MEVNAAVCAGPQEVFNRKPKAATEVSDAVLSRIRKALALGLHAGGNPMEKEHAMRRATKLMQEHGLSRDGAFPGFCHYISKTADT
jgi:hypothetical protein